MLRLPWRKDGSLCLSARGQENGLWGSSSKSARNAPERESVLALSAAGRALFKPRHNDFCVLILTHLKSIATALPFSPILSLLGLVCSGLGQEVRLGGTSCHTQDGWYLRWYVQQLCCVGLAHSGRRHRSQ